MLRRRFRAMGTDVELLLDAAGKAGSFHALAEAEIELRRLEGLLSRFDPASELSRLNRAGSLQVGPDLLEVTSLALAARTQSGGRFDPTVHDALVAAGYDRDFDHLEPASASSLPGASRCGGRVVVDLETSRIELGEGVRIDLGGIAKGYGADRATLILGEAGPCLVNVGGDIAGCGRPWPVGVETPEGTITLELAAGAVATSGRDRRTWQHGDQTQHHLVDPATGRPSDSDLLRATAVAATAAEAEALATSLFLAGSATAAREADLLGIPTVLVTADGRVQTAGGLR